MECESLENDVLLDMKSRGNFLCMSCKGLPDRGNGSFSDEGEREMDTSTMDTEERLMAGNDDEPRTQHDGEANQVTQDVEISGNIARTLSSTPIVRDDRLSKSSVISPHSSTSKHAPKSELRQQLDKIMEMVSNTQENVGILQQKINMIDENQEGYLNNTAVQIQDSVHKSVSNAVKTLESDLKQNVAKDVMIAVEKKLDHKVDQKFDDNLTKRIDKQIGQRIDSELTKKLDDKFMCTFEQKINERFCQIEQRLDHKLNQAESMMDDKIDEAIDDYQDANWRKKNLILVNIPESTKRVTVDRQNDDYLEAYQIINKLVDFEEADLECKPVRVGKFQNDKPRLLRLTLKSEYMVRIIANKARDNSDLLNPDEKDNKKKIYINKDFSYKARENRKEALKEKKVREEQGEENLTIWRNKVVKKDELLEEGQFARKRIMRGKRTYAGAVRRAQGYRLGHHRAAPMDSERYTGNTQSNINEKERPQGMPGIESTALDQNQANIKNQNQKGSHSQPHKPTQRQLNPENGAFQMPKPLYETRKESMKGRSPMVRDSIEMEEELGAVGGAQRPQFMNRDYFMQEEMMRERERFYLPPLPPFQFFGHGRPRLDRGGNHKSGRRSGGLSFYDY